MKLIAFLLTLFTTLILQSPLLQASEKFEDEPLTEQQLINAEDERFDSTEFAFSPVIPDPSESDKNKILGKYSYLDPQNQVPKSLLQSAIIYYEANYSLFPNHSFLAVIDYSKRSSEKRFFVIDLQSGAVHSFHMAHGKGSDSASHNGYADKFGNVPDSGMSSLGFARTADRSYISHPHQNTPALRLIGLSKSNSNMLSRAVVIHGAWYVKDENVIEGRSQGCPAVSLANVNDVTRMLEGGALILLGTSK